MPKIVKHQPTRDRVARNLARLLQLKKMEAKALAAETSVARSAIYKIKNAGTGVTIDVLGRLAMGLRCDVDEFFKK